MGQLFGLLASVASSKTVVQAGGAVILLQYTLLWIFGISSCYPSLLYLDLLVHAFGMGLQSFTSQ